jgi:hypothetical protein
MGEDGGEAFAEYRDGGIAEGIPGHERIECRQGRPIAYPGFGWLTRSHSYRGGEATGERSMTHHAVVFGGAASDRERLSVLGAFAAPREPGRCREGN